MLGKTATVVLTFASIATGTLSLLSYGRTLGISCYPANRVHVIAGVVHGYVAISVFEDAARTESSRTVLINAPLSDVQRSYKPQSAFGTSRGFSGTYHGAMFPASIPCLVFAIYPIIAFIRGPWRRHWRKKRGLCVSCGYNLTGNESGTCPECGHGR